MKYLAFFASIGATLGYAGGCTSTQSLRTELIATERAWLAAAAANDVAASASFLTDDAVIYFADGSPVVGKEALTAMLTSARQTEGFSIDWSMSEAVVARSGDLAYSLGPYTMSLPGASGQLVTQRGHYLSIWRRDNGVWRCSLEIHASLPSPPGSSAADATLRTTLVQQSP